MHRADGRSRDAGKEEGSVNHFYRSPCRVGTAPHSWLIFLIQAHRT